MLNHNYNVDGIEHGETYYVVKRTYGLAVEFHWPEDSNSGVEFADYYDLSYLFKKFNVINRRMKNTPEVW